jgi:hypothetical protein
LWRLPYTEVIVCHKQRVEVFPFESVLRTDLGSLSLLGLVILDEVHITILGRSLTISLQAILSISMKFKCPNV